MVEGCGGWRWRRRGMGEEEGLREAVDLSVGGSTSARTSRMSCTMAETVEMVMK